MWIGIIILGFSITIINGHGDFVRHTTHGLVRGRIWKSQKGREFLGFTGIPYAKPPVGNLRFKAPVPAEPWHGVLDATKTHSQCSQIDYLTVNFTAHGKEDCLYLNIYTPLTGHNYPVMFYVYGGSFLTGSGADNWIGPEILLDQNVVLVVINYRLGSLGFLSTEDQVQPGNGGLKDQAMALRWIYDNIYNFGGNKFSITVFGNSAGGVSAQLLTISPLTRDLVARVAIQSSPAVTPYGYAPRGVQKHNTEALAKLLNCPTDTSNNILNCLKEVDVVEVLRNERVVSSSAAAQTFFQPIIEVPNPGAFISEDPVKTIMTRKYANVPILIGVVEQEGAYRTAEIFTSPGQLESLNENFTDVAALSFSITKDVEKTTKALRQFYFGSKTIDKSAKMEITDLHSDGWYVANMDVALYLLLRYKFPDQHVYLYLFGYRGSISYTELYGDFTTNYGVCHTDELFYLLTQRQSFPYYKPTAKDMQMSAVLTQLWTNFARTGNPTPRTKLWKPLRTHKLEHLHIQGPNQLNMEEGLFAARRKFWRDNVFQSVWQDLTKPTQI